ncbi:TOPRIM domain-containing protein [Pyrolobus fumarii 1A]|uniref:DNA primase DnaG n=1 Tax=Pyrolobus fumarii (strain DSM 11204 / 1A) TaxID=694429 RepID=G0EG29_PYRF1|nr:DNA primase DnaG [Pyrolobus fumarii]AEM38277.1 TOPRIM domain-containing protein [Pyrolobus fumarii 1A]
MKYLIRAKLEVDGIVDKHDVVGAIFGQTENLFGEDFDLRELQERGRIGRIQVDIRHVGSRTVGEVTVPSNLDRVETALLAAMLESVERVGPYRARIQVYDIIDVRAEKIKRIVERAKEILRTWAREKTPDLREVLREISESVKAAELVSYGPEGLPAGPDVDKAPEIIIVEGRADVLNLLRYGYRNVIALEGARGKIPETIIKLAKEKTAIAFVDGDHGGDLILMELLRAAPIDYVARAPPGKEVEELTGREIEKALRNKVPAKQYLETLEKRLKRRRAAPQPTPPAPPAQPQQPQAAQQPAAPQPTPPQPAPPQPAAVQQPQPPQQVVAKPAPPTPPPKVEEKPPAVKAEVVELPESVIEEAKKLQGTLEALIYDRDWKLIEKVPVRLLAEKLEQSEPGKVFAVVFDGIVTQRLLDIAAKKGVKLLIGARIGNVEKRPEGVQMLTFNELIS